MIISENNKPQLEAFRLLMKATDSLLNSEAPFKEEYYFTRNGTQLEVDVYDALCQSAKNTPFENTIHLVSGSSFPDIVANKFYGVEVKSTNKNHWKSIGGSILESTRDQNVERIFLTFGKLGKPVQFMSRPYEECLSGISVTHYPRYQIDMKLNEGETIFDKIGIEYDELRKMENPVAPVSKYYKKQLKDGESLWWAPDGDLDELEVPVTVRLWSSLSPDQKTYYKAQGYALFPEIFSFDNSSKYQRYALWLATTCGIVNTNIRDLFSAGGQADIVIGGNLFEKMPAVYVKIEQNVDVIIQTILDMPESVLKEYWRVDRIEPNRINQWCKLVAFSSEKIGYEKAYAFLKSLFLL